jgi:two-component system chemotaxis sensor kinase CheA
VPAAPAAAAAPATAVAATQTKATGSSGANPNGSRQNVSDSAIRVDVNLLDGLMNLVGELVLARNQILQFTARFEDLALTASSQRLDLITTELQDGVMKTRMQPIGVVWNKLPRVVRDLSAAVGKQIHLEMEGADTELDKTIIEAIKDPLTHIVRNSCDHGIEEPAQRVAAGKAPQGRLQLRAFHEGGHVNIEIIDDGKGIDAARVKQRAVERGLLTLDAAARMSDREAYQLIFAPGLSTAEKVSNISGRGVGMDVVRTNIEQIGGTVDVQSTLGEGATVRLKIPLTLAIIPGLVVTTLGERYVIPQASLLELIRLEGEQIHKQIERIHGVPVYRRRGSLLPLAFLSDLFRPGAGMAETTQRRRATDRPAVQSMQESLDADIVNIVVLQAESQLFGLVVDGIHDTQEIVVKPLSKQLKGLNCYAGATIMGDGKVALILDVSGLQYLSGIHQAGSGSAEAANVSAAPRIETQSFLLFRAGKHERLAVPLALVARLEEIRQEQLEGAAGQLVIQYRGEILPLLHLSEVLGGSAGGKATAAVMQVIVFTANGQSAGLLVDEIIDIVDGDMSTRKATQQAGILASILLDGKVTDVLDLRYLLGRPPLNWFSDKPAVAADQRHVLLAEPEAFQRHLLKTALQVEGYRVTEATGAQDVIRSLTEEDATAALVSENWKEAERELLQAWIRKQSRQRRFRVLGLQAPAGSQPQEPQASAYDAWVNPAEAVHMLNSLLLLRENTQPDTTRKEELASA